MFIAVLFKTRKQPECPLTEGRVKKMWHIYAQLLKRMKSCHFSATWMGLEIVTLSEVSPTEKEIYHVASLICGI